MSLTQLFNQENLTLIDVREPYEFAAGYAEGAINIPLGSLPANVDRIRRMPQPVVVYCRSGMRSGQAEQFLRSAGVAQVYNAGGLAEVLQYQKLANV